MGEARSNSAMNDGLRVAIGQYSDKGRKAINQDFHGAIIPQGLQLSTKGVAIALADGISSSDVSHLASQIAVTTFLEDYYCTSETWSVKKSAQRVLLAANSWLHAQTRQSQHRYDRDKGYVCTLSALIIKSATAHLFHVGDARIYKVHDAALEQLTQDHRIRVSSVQTYLGRALGISQHVEIDYKALSIEKGDVFILATDGVYEYVDQNFITRNLKGFGDNLEGAARSIVNEAYRRGSNDNLSVQILRVDDLPDASAYEFYQKLSDLPCPPALQPRMWFDGYRVVRELHASSRSHVYLATDVSTNETVVIKTPSLDLWGDEVSLERFLMEEWIARRINSAHVLKPCSQEKKRHYLYLVAEYIEGQTLAQWMLDHPRARLEAMRGIIKQIALGLRAFHRLEMLHQDLKPSNIMIDAIGTVKIIDFGSAQVAGILEAGAITDRHPLVGDAAYAAPEYFLGESGSMQSDLFSLGVIAYQMLSGRLPYGTEVPRVRTKSSLRRLKYTALVHFDRSIPSWVDGAIRKAVHPNPVERYGDVDEFIHDLFHPNKDFMKNGHPPLVDRDPVLFWKSVSFALAATILVMLVLHSLIH